jgi:probable HAF family extracellular repeat protein
MVFAVGRHCTVLRSAQPDGRVAGQGWTTSNEFRKTVVSVAPDGGREIAMVETLCASLSRITRWSLVLVVAGAFGVISVQSQAQQYMAIDLGTLGGTFSEGHAINTAGQVTGFATKAGDVGGYFAFLYSNGTMTNLGTLGGLDTYGFGINTSGEVAGYGLTAGNSDFNAFLYSNGKMTDLGTLGGTDSEALGINASGQVVGDSSVAGDTAAHAFIYSQGTMTDLGVLSGGQNSTASGVNASGQVTGEGTYNAIAGPATAHAFLYSNGKMTDLGTLGGSTSSGEGINANGQVTGYSYIAGNTAKHAFITNAATNAMTDLGTLGGTDSEGLGINASGEVVGDSEKTSLTSEVGFLYRDSQMLDLNTLLTQDSASQYTITSATGINDAGQIVANGYINETRQYTAFLLMPIPSAVKLSATSLAFGNEAVNGTSASKSISLTNSGTAPLSISSIMLSGSTADDFSLTKTCGASLAAGASCTISVTFKPVSAGGKAALISIADNANGSPQFVALSGTGTAATGVPTVALSATSLAFGSGAVNGTSPSKSISLTNSGAAPVSVSSITLSGSTADDFSFTKTCGASLAAGASCTISATFKPVSAGGKAASISITDNASGSPQSVALSGTGLTVQ